MDCWTNVYSLEGRNSIFAGLTIKTYLLYLHPFFIFTTTTQYANLIFTLESQFNDSVQSSHILLIRWSQFYLLKWKTSVDGHAACNGNAYLAFYYQVLDRM